MTTEFRIAMIPISCEDVRCNTCVVPWVFFDVLPSFSPFANEDNKAAQVTDHTINGEDDVGWRCHGRQLELVIRSCNTGEAPSLSCQTDNRCRLSCQAVSSRDTTEPSRHRPAAAAGAQTRERRSAGVLGQFSGLMMMRFYVDQLVAPIDWCFNHHG